MHTKEEKSVTTLCSYFSINGKELSLIFLPLSICFPVSLPSHHYLKCMSNIQRAHNPSGSDLQRLWLQLTVLWEITLAHAGQN